MGKICSKCKKEYPLDNFYKQSKRKGGKHPWCKPCCKEHQKKNMSRRVELESKKWRDDPEYRQRRLELQRNWSKKNIEYKRQKEKENRLKNPIPYKRRVRRYADAHPEEMKTMARARQKVYQAIKKGEMIRPNECEWCGSYRNIQAAHYDYDRPLEVKWLCKPCHAKWDYEEPKIMRTKEAE